MTLLLPRRARAFGTLDESCSSHAKRHEREKQELLSASNRITDAILKIPTRGCSSSTRATACCRRFRIARALFRRQDFAQPDLREAARTRGHRQDAERGTQLHRAPACSGEPAPGSGGTIRSATSRSACPRPMASFDAAHYSFEFCPVEIAPEQRAWLVRVTDITQRGADRARARGSARARADARRDPAQRAAGGRRALRRVAASSRRLDEDHQRACSKKPAREQEAFRHKLEETLEEVDRVRRDAAAFQLSALEASARQFEDALHDLRSRPALSGSDFLPLAVKLDQLYGQFALLKTLRPFAATAARGEARGARRRSMTANGTQIIESPKFMADAARPHGRAGCAAARRPRRKPREHPAGAHRSRGAGAQQDGDAAGDRARPGAPQPINRRSRTSPSSSFAMP